MFSLLTTGRLTSLWIVLETWVLRDGFRCPLLGATEELFFFCLVTRGQGQALSRTSLLRADSCKGSPCCGVCSPQPAPEPTFPGSLLPAWDSSVSLGACPLFVACWVTYLGELLPVSENREATGELWIRNRIWVMMQQSREMRRGHLRPRRRRRITGWAGGTCALL